MSEVEKHGFQTEVNQLLKLMIHSLYSEKEIFLRELISNASDACDKLRYQSLTNPELIEDQGELAVYVSFDEKKRTITIKDNGIGMSHDDVIENIGTIARSGTKDFLESLTGEKSKDAQLIGQFGVGFYSVFMVAEQVTLATRKAGLKSKDGVIWSSDGQGEYTVESADIPERGTTITLKLKKQEKEFLNDYRLKSIIRKYSEHISLPIYMLKTDSDDDKGKEKSDGENGSKRWESVNAGTALWARAKREIKKDEYNQFYTSMTYDSEEPLAVLHNHVEGKQQYTTLFFIPKKAPFDLWDRDRKSGIKLYVRRVFIMDDTKHLLPSYLRFVRGLVDANDLPLNVSREFLQKNAAIDKIKSASVKKILNEINKISDKKPEEYQFFWDEFGKVMKEGVVEDFENRDTLQSLLRFSTTHSMDEKQSVSLSDYVSRMPAEQKSIYYLTADSHTAAKNSPHLELFKKNNIEVLLLSDPVDEWLVAHLHEFEGKPLKSIAKGADIDDLHTDEAKQKVKEQQKDYSDLIESFKKALESKAKDVRLSQRLTDSPACLVADEHDLGGNMERLLKSMGQNAPSSKPIMEINAEHPILVNLKENKTQIEDWANVLYDQAALSEGAPLSNPSEYVKRVNSLLSKNLV